jgi:catalase
LTAARFVDAFERVAGIHSGFRRNHAKGVCVSGFFESNGQGMRLSKAVVFRTGRTSVIGRFSFGGGNPYVTDAPDMVRGLGLLFWLSDGEEWRTAMINLPVFPVKTPQAFFDNLVAGQPDPQTHKPDPEKMETFLARHPEAVQAMKIIKSHSVSSGFENSTYNGLNAFRFVDVNGASIPARWSMAPVQPFVAANTTAADQGDKNYLFDALIASILQRPLQWHLMITVGQPGDVTDDASIPWPDGREQVDVGTLTLDSVESEETSPARVRPRRPPPGRRLPDLLLVFLYLRHPLAARLWNPRAASRLALGFRCGGHRNAVRSGGVSFRTPMAAQSIRRQSR